MDFDEICGGNHYQQQINWLQFEWNCTKAKEQDTSTVSNRRCKCRSITWPHAVFSFL